MQTCPGQGDLISLFRKLDTVFRSHNEIKPEGVLTLCTIGLSLGAKFDTIANELYEYMKIAMT